MNTEDKKQCQNCGQWMEADSNHCSNCGVRLSDSSDGTSGHSGPGRYSGRKGYGLQREDSHQRKISSTEGGADEWNEYTFQSVSGIQEGKRKGLYDLDEFERRDGRGGGFKGERRGTRLSTVMYGKKTKFYKKWWFWVIIAVLLIGIIGCAAGSDSDEKEDPAPNSRVEQAQNSLSESSEEENEIPNPLKQREIIEEDILGEDGQPIGRRAYIEFPEDDFFRLTNMQIADFVLGDIYGRKDHHFTIVFGNGRGIVFPECRIKEAELGTIDDFGSIVTAEKIMTVTLLGKVKWKDAVTGLGTENSSEGTVQDSSGSDAGQEISSGSGDNISAPDSSPAGASDNTEESPLVSIEYRNALKSAETYSRYMHMSKQGIYDQLISEYGDRFPADAAQYAVDHVNADWKANALEKAKSYQQTMSMSNAAIYDQLISEYGEKFTPEEAQYAVDNLG